MRVTALAGGVGAARMLKGLISVVPPASVTAIVNTADDMVLHGLYISPDVDTVTYTLAGESNPETGWGLTGESWAVKQSLEAFEEVAPGGTGSLTWFNLGDRDLATHLYRTGRMAQGASLSQVTAEVARRFGLATTLLPMSDDAVRTMVTVNDPQSPLGQREVNFQDYFVAMRHSVPVTAVRFAGSRSARPGPDVLSALDRADVVVICPSNPVVSIGPLLAVPGISEAVAAKREAVVAVSPIVAGRALKGPADHMLSELGHEPSVVGVARMWADVAGALVIDPADADRASEVEEAGVRCIVAPSVMSGPPEAARLAHAVVGAAAAGTR